MMSITSPGKINLFLDVTAKREDGYHEILTLFLPVKGLEDRIFVEESSQLEIVCEHPGVPTDERNLCWKAAELFAEAANISAQWKITIEKNLPVAGGMGGGSSNAGSLLKLLSERFPGKVSSDHLKKIALKIGADVPFFLNPLPSIASGVGEELERTALRRDIHSLLITFPFPVAASWAYVNRNQGFSRSQINKEKLEKLWQEGELSSLVYNDLSFALRGKFPILQQAKDDLLSCGALGAEVSGSGPTVFAIFETEEKRDRCRGTLLAQGYSADQLIAVSAG